VYVSSALKSFIGAPPQRSPHGDPRDLSSHVN